MARADADTRRIRALRLRAQGLVPGVRTWASPAEVARGMLAMQAQDGAGVRWALACRMSDETDDEAVLAAVAAGEVVRNRPSRGTLQVTAPEDMHWLSATMTPRALAAAAKRRDQLGVTEAMIESVGRVLRDELTGGVTRTRPELVEAAAAAGIPLESQQASHVLGYHTQVMTIVVAGPRPTTETFALAEEWIDRPRRVDRAAALAEIAQRYVAARGPATTRDLARWTHLTMGDVRAGLAAAADHLRTVTLGGTDYHVAADTPDLSVDAVEEALAEPLLLAPFDEYLLGYADRTAIVTDAHSERIVPGRNGVFKPIVVVDGEVVGAWNRRLRTNDAVVVVEPFVPLPRSVRAALAGRAESYARFLDRPVDIGFSSPA